MRYAALLAALAVLGGPCPAQHGTPAFRPPRATASWVELDSMMLQHLEQLAETSHVEDGRCLIGVVVNDTAYVLAAADAPWTVSEPTVDLKTGEATLDQHWGLCPTGTIGLWHSHPLRLARILLGERTDRWCRMSPPDQFMWMSSRFTILMISTRSDHTCIYARTQGDSIDASLP